MSDSPLQTDFLDMVDEPMRDSNPKDPRAAATVSVVQPMGGAAKLGHGVRSPVQDPSSCQVDISEGPGEPEPLARHPLSELFSRVRDGTQNDIVGLLQRQQTSLPVAVWHGKVVWGWENYLACLQAEVAPNVIDIDGDPITFLSVVEMYRKGLSKGQKSVITVGMCDWLEGGDSKSPPPDHMRRDTPFSVKEMVKLADVSKRHVQRAKVVWAKGLGSQVIEGQLSLNRAYSLATKPGMVDRPSPAALPPRRELEERIKLLERERDDYAQRLTISEARAQAAEGSAKAEAEARAKAEKRARELETEISRLTALMPGDAPYAS